MQGRGERLRAHRQGVQVEARRLHLWGPVADADAREELRERRRHLLRGASFHLSLSAISLRARRSG
jgi:hypothetical protein